ncbi:MAG: hypothetical protein HC834_01695 [Rhodospirillales bacterium]|nr:hypothetical protein [Rhodospirillales bacterium]
MRTFLPVLAVALAAALWTPALIAESPEPTFPTNDVQLVVPPGALAGPDFDVEKATQAYVETLSAEKRARSDAYFEGGYWLLLWSLLYGLAVAWIVLGLRISAWIRSKAEAVSARKNVQTLVYALLYTPLATILVFRSPGMPSSIASTSTRWPPRPSASG